MPTKFWRRKFGKGVSLILLPARQPPRPLPSARVHIDVVHCAQGIGWHNGKRQKCFNHAEPERHLRCGAVDWAVPPAGCRGKADLGCALHTLSYDIPLSQTVLTSYAFGGDGVM